MGGARVPLTALAGAIALGLLAGCGGASDEDLRDARKEGRQEERIRQLERDLAEQRRNGRQRGSRAGGDSSGSGGGTTVAGSSSPAGRSSCSTGLWVGPNTTCAFAENVRSGYPGSHVQFEVYSPVTDRYYTMECADGSPHVCTGGNDASVYFD